MRKKALNLLATTLLFFSSCTNKEQPPIPASGCDCTGAPAVVVTDATARLTAGRRLFLKDVDYSKAAYRELIPCDTLKIAGLPASKDSVFDYVVSGELRPPCITNGVTYFWSINIGSISKK
ncbi:hypothetical protein [Spirosoma sp. KNUC1025]|uniref:hypothetical protein n=1 Tax=Spirosoma sp. KNUC1025 TaxID=2894082 RepID=UPI0038636691|nr:hypothetical protein LN737_28565 [Spirosoma sp. KNUC1025]